MATPTQLFHDAGPGNTYIPAAREQLQVEFSRNPNDFGIAQWMQIIPTDKQIGYYAEMDSIEPTRVVTQNDYVWADGQPRPKGKQRPFRWKKYATERRAYNFTLGNLSVEQASFDVVAANARGDAAQAMTDRTLDGLNVVTTPGNWPSTNTSATVAALIGTAGSWFSSSTSEQFIKHSFAKVRQAINKQTGSVAGKRNLGVVINPVAADQMGRTAEISAYLVQHEQAMANLNMIDQRLLDEYGLPPYLYGIKVTVEDTVQTSTRRTSDDSATTDYGLSTNTSFFYTRQGGVAGPTTDANGNAAPNMSTICGFFKEEMTVETRQESWDRLTEGSVVEDRDIVLAAPISGYLVQDISQ